MSQENSNIAVSFNNIHKVITRGLRVTIESCQKFLQQGPPDKVSLQGFFNYTRAFSSIVNSHHLTEDELAFPYFRELMPGAHFDSLSETHRLMVHVLDEIKLALDVSEKSGLHETELRTLLNAVTRLNEMWHPHIKIETDEFINQADSLIPVEEQLRLVRLFSEHGQRLATPPFLTVPFLLYNLSVEDRKVFSQDMPEELTQNLVPIVWKEKWESMKPYLLT